MLPPVALFASRRETRNAHLQRDHLFQGLFPKRPAGVQLRDHCMR